MEFDPFLHINKFQSITHPSFKPVLGLEYIRNFKRFVLFYKMLFDLAIEIDDDDGHSTIIRLLKKTFLELEKHLGDEQRIFRRIVNLFFINVQQQNHQNELFHVKQVAFQTINMTIEELIEMKMLFVRALQVGENQRSPNIRFENITIDNQQYTLSSIISKFDQYIDKLTLQIRRF